MTNEQLAKVSRFLKAYNVTGDLQRRVHSYLLQFFENQEREDTKSLLMVWLKKPLPHRFSTPFQFIFNYLSMHFAWHLAFKPLSFSVLLRISMSSGRSSFG